MSALESLLLGAAGGGAATIAYIELRVRWHRHQARMAHHARAQKAHEQRVDWEYLAGVTAGRVLAQMGHRRPAYYPSHDAGVDAHRRGIQAGWSEGRAELREAERWTADGIEQQVEDWKGDTAA